MNTAFSEALGPFSKRMPRAVRDIEILRVSAQIDGEDYAASAEAARKEALKWAKKRAGRAIPKAAWDLQDFEVLVEGRSCTGINIENDALDLWALRVEDPDDNVPGRIWSTEIVIGGEDGSRPHASLRLIVSTTEQDFTIEPHVPGPVMQMIEAPGLIRGARQLFSAPVTIQTENDAEDLRDHLEGRERRLPIFVAAVPEGGGKPHINTAVLAKAVARLARIVLVPAELTGVLTKRFGKYRSVFNGGVRAYLLGFSAAEFEDVTLVARAIAWLETIQHDRRVNGGGSLRDVQVENGILNSPCGGDTYAADWKGRRYEVDWHIKTGGNTRDPKRCLRIYYFWEAETQQTIIDHLPSHRRASAT